MNNFSVEISHVGSIHLDCWIAGLLNLSFLQCHSFIHKRQYLQHWRWPLSQAGAKTGRISPLLLSLIKIINWSNKMINIQTRVIAGSANSPQPARTHRQDFLLPFEIQSIESKSFRFVVPGMHDVRSSRRVEWAGKGRWGICHVRRDIISLTESSFTFKMLQINKFPY